MQNWEQLQTLIEETLKELDGPSYQSKRSGAVKGDGDVKSPSFLVECKDRTKKNHIVERGWIKKVEEEANINRKIPLVATRNQYGEVVISTTLDNFKLLLQKGRKNAEDKRRCRCKS